MASATGTGIDKGDGGARDRNNVEGLGGKEQRGAKPFFTHYRICKSSSVGVTISAPTPGPNGQLRGTPKP